MVDLKIRFLNLEVCGKDFNNYCDIVAFEISTIVSDKLSAVGELRKKILGENVQNLVTKSFFCSLATPCDDIQNRS